MKKTLFILLIYFATVTAVNADVTAVSWSVGYVSTNQIDCSIGFLYPLQIDSRLVQNPYFSSIDFGTKINFKNFDFYTNVQAGMSVAFAGMSLECSLGFNNSTDTLNYYLRPQMMFHFLFLQIKGGYEIYLNKNNLNTPFWGIYLGFL